MPLFNEAVGDQKIEIQNLKFKNSLPVVWTIAGSDSGGGAGIQVDLKTINAFGVHGCSVITAVTAQNTLGIHAAESVSPSLLRAQLQALATDLPPVAIKLGMLGRAESCSVVAEFMGKVQGSPLLICDPVIQSTSGATLLDEDALDLLIHGILPKVGILTPNLPEAEALVGQAFQTMEAAAERILELGVGSVLIKGGHAEGDKCRDYWTDGMQSLWLSSPRIETSATHGTGCILSSAIASAVALGQTLPEALVTAKTFLNQCLKSPANIGAGHGPMRIDLFRNAPEDPPVVVGGIRDPAPQTTVRGIGDPAPQNPGSPIPVTNADPGSPIPVTTADPGSSSPVTNADPGSSIPVTTADPGSSSPVTNADPGSSSPVTNADPGSPSPVTTADPGSPSPVTNADPGSPSPVTNADPGSSIPATNLRDAHSHLRRLSKIFVNDPAYFVTTNTNRRRRILNQPAVHRILHEEWERALDRHGWAVGSYVVMPDHVHFFCKPTHDAIQLSRFMQQWKQWTSKRIKSELQFDDSVWQEEFFDHLLRSHESYSEKWNYVEQNPVRAGLVDTASGWPYSGFVHYK